MAQGRDSIVASGWVQQSIRPHSSPAYRGFQSPGNEQEFPVTDSLSSNGVVTISAAGVRKMVS